VTFPHAGPGKGVVAELRLGSLVLGDLQLEQDLVAVENLRFV
jgi:hypothetical protein